MKNISIYIILFVTWFIPCNAQQRTIERIYLSTDRVHYVAGESIWLSLYCFDMTDKNTRLSNVSSVAYVELRNAASLVSSAKLQIDRGRGSGRIEIPISLPTGNYTLIAYTKQMLNEEVVCCFEVIIPIFNTLSTNRVAGNVQIKDDDMTDISTIPATSDSKHVEVMWRECGNTIPRNYSLPILLKNMSDEAMSLTLSIVKTDIPTTQKHSLHDFFINNQLDPVKIAFQERYIPEYEGEIIRGRIKNIDDLPSKERSIFLSTVGDELNVYAAAVDTTTGEFSFFTNSLHGNRELVLEYPSVNEVSFELFDPFVKPFVKPVPTLYLEKKHEPALEQRSIEMQVNRRFGIDSLYDRTTTSGIPFLYNNKPVVYVLDNYTRFPEMQDIMIEFISEMRFRRIQDKPSLQVLLKTELGWTYSENPLTVIDGIALFDHERLLQYDPLKVKTVTIYQNRYRIGNKIFNGIAKFDTYTGNYPGLTLGKNALIFDFQGVQYPCWFTDNIVATSKNVPDLRTLLYWNPQVDFEHGDSLEVILRTSAVSGNYSIILEGITISGKAVWYRAEFTVE